jgi:hypothetical protein
MSPLIGSRDSFKTLKSESTANSGPFRASSIVAGLIDEAIDQRPSLSL